MKKKIILPILVLFVAGTVSGMEAEMEVIDRSAGETPAEFTMNITNNYDTEERFRLSVMSSQSSWFSMPSRKTVEPGQTENISFRIHSPDTAVQKNYDFTVRVRSPTYDETVSVTDYFSVDSSYDIIINEIWQNSQSFKPGDNLELGSEVLNLKTSEIEEYSLKLDSPHFNSTTSGLPLDSGEKRSYTFNESIGVFDPGEYQASITIVQEGEEKHQRFFNYEIEEKKDVRVNERSDDMIFYRQNYLEAENIGNTRSEGNLTAEIPGYLEPVTFFSDEADQVIDSEDGLTFVWNYDLKPEDSRNIDYSINLWIPTAALLGIAITVLGLRNHIKNIKIVKSVKKVEDGVKIKIEVDNDTGKSLENVEIKDFVPDIASVKQDFEFAKPVIRKTSNGTKLNWSIDNLEKGDQRVFEYVIKPQITVEEKVTLPEAEIYIRNQRIQKSDKVKSEFKT